MSRRQKIEEYKKGDQDVTDEDGRKMKTTQIRWDFLDRKRCRTS